jgi:hypothetical protein
MPMQRRDPWQESGETYNTHVHTGARWLFYGTCIWWEGNIATSSIMLMYCCNDMFVVVWCCRGDVLMVMFWVVGTVVMSYWLDHVLKRHVIVKVMYCGPGKCTLCNFYLVWWFLLWSCTAVMPSHVFPHIDAVFLPWWCTLVGLSVNALVMECCCYGHVLRWCTVLVVMYCVWWTWFPWWCVLFVVLPWRVSMAMYCWYCPLLLWCYCHGHAHVHCWCSVAMIMFCGGMLFFGGHDLWYSILGRWLVVF